MDDKKTSIKIFLISAMTCVYVILFFFLLFYFSNKYNLAENSSATLEPKASAIAALTSLPVMILYIIYVIRNFFRIKYLKCLSYPLIIVNLYVGASICLITFAGFWMLVMVVVTLLPFIAAVLLSFGIGIILDVRYMSQERLK